MSSPTLHVVPALSPLLLLARTLAIGAVGAGLAYWAGLPAAMLSGALGGVAAAAVTGVRVAVDERLRQLAFVVVGAVLGSAVHPETLALIGQWPISLAALAGSVGVLMIAVPAYLMTMHGFDRITARLSAVPGALSYVLAVAEATTADVRRVAVLQTLRLASLMLLVPVIVKLTMETGDQFRAPVAAISMVDLGWLMALCGAAGLIAQFVALPAAALVLSMLVSGVLHASGMVSGAPPVSMAWPALIVTGSAIGARFSGVDRIFLVESLRAGLVSLLIAAAIASMFAWPVADALGVPFAQVWLAFAPGGIDTMTVLAFALGVDPAFVAGHQLLRFLGLSLVVPFVFRTRH